MSAPDLFTTPAPVASPTPPPVLPYADPSDTRKPCAVCGRLNSSFGVGMSLLHGKPGRWACSAEHVESLRGMR